jgi:nitrogen regulatory protein PII 2
MKMIIAFIRMVKMNDTKDALAAAGLPSFMASGEVQGRGRGRGLGPNFEKIKSDPDMLEQLKEYGPEPRLKNKRMITLVVANEKVELAVQTIIAFCIRTGCLVSQVRSYSTYIGHNLAR